jgi:hypothetical protein
MNRSSLVRLAFLLLLTSGLSVALAPAAPASTSIGNACPAVSCLTQTGYNQCVAAGCGCDPRTDACVPRVQPIPVPACPAVSCLTEGGYQQCAAAGCGCDPRTDACVGQKVVPDGE